MKRDLFWLLIGLNILLLLAVPFAHVGTANNDKIIISIEEKQ